MNTRFHVPTKVFGTRRSRGERTEGEPGSGLSAVSPATGNGSDPILVDPMLNDSPGKSSSYLIPGSRTALIDPGSANAAPRVLEYLKANRIEVDLVLLTHIHPDAAAGAGVITRHFPEADIAAPAGSTERLTDRTAMVTDMKKVYGDRAEMVYGLPTPVDAVRITALADGDRIDLGQYPDRIQ